MFEIKQTKERIEYRNGISSTPKYMKYLFFKETAEKKGKKIISEEIKMTEFI